MVNQQQIEAALQPHLQVLEPKRIAFKRQIIFTGLACLAIVVLIVSVSYSFISNLSEAVRPELAILFISLCTFFPTFLASFIAWQQFNIQKAAVHKAYQALIRKEGYLPVFQEWNTSLTYSPEQVISQEELTRAAVIDTYDVLKGDDYCEGTLEDGRPFRFSEIELLEERERWGSDGYKEIYYAPLFKGLFFALENTRPYSTFSSHLKLEARTTHLEARRSSLKDFFRSSTTDILDAGFEVLSSGNKDSLEHHFDIDKKEQSYTSSFSPALKKQLIELKEDLQGQLTLVFDQDTCYIAVSHEGEFWHTPLHQSLKEPRIYQHLAWNFAHCFMILEEVAAMTTMDN